MLAKLLEYRYHKKSIPWLKQLNEKQLNTISKLIFEIEDFDTLKTRIENNNEY